jgi:hypothetical protein
MTTDVTRRLGYIQGRRKISIHKLNFTGEITLLQKPSRRLPSYPMADCRGT